MNIKRFIFLGSIFSSALLWLGCGNDSNAKTLTDTGFAAVTSQQDTVEVQSSNDGASTPVKANSSYTPAQRALLESYPDQIKDIKDNYVILANGVKILYDDGKKKDFMGLLDDSDVEDMFVMPYKLPDPVPEYQYDPGRGRSEALFKAMYGDTKEKVHRNLKTVDWFGTKVSFQSLNGAADSLKAVAKELAQHPNLKKYLSSSGTFNWRPVRGAKRMSAHSYGIAFDIGVKGGGADYWQWKIGSNDEFKKVPYANKIPLELVEIFQKHGFIWGGAWYHYDTMHFEFRPDLLRYSELIQE